MREVINKDQHRYSYSGGVKAKETSKWGADTAARRYGAPKFENGAPLPKDASYPQFRTDQPADKNYGDTANDWRRGNGMKPNFDSVGRKGYHGKR